MARPGSWNGADQTHPGITPDDAPKPNSKLGEIFARKVLPGGMWHKAGWWIHDRPFRGTLALAAVLGLASAAIVNFDSIVDTIGSYAPDIKVPDLEFDLPGLMNPTDAVTTSGSRSLIDLATDSGASAAAAEVPAPADTAVATATPAEVAPKIPTDSDQLPGGAKALAGAEVAPPETPTTATAHHASRETYDLAERNLSGVADNTLIPNPTDDQIRGYQTVMHSRGIDMSDAEARQALEDGGFESRGITYENWRMNSDPTNFTATEVHKDHWLNGNVHHIDTAPPTPDAAPAEFSDADKDQYQKFVDASTKDQSFHPNPDHYQQAALSRDGAFGDEAAMRTASHTLSDYTPAEIAQHQPPADAPPEVQDAWLKMQAWLNGEAQHLPHATDSKQLISTYLLSIGMIG